MKAQYYFNTAKFEIFRLNAGEKLPANEKCIKLSFITLVMLAPIMGLMFIGFLPLIGSLLVLGLFVSGICRIFKAGVNKG